MMRVVVVLFVLALPSIARAAAMPEPPPPPPPIPVFPIEQGVATDRALDVRCEALSREAARCTMTLELDVVANGDADASFFVPIANGVHVDPTLEDDPARPGWIRVPASERAHVRIVAVRTIAVGTAGEQRYVLMADALYTRHMLLATRSPRMGGEGERTPGGYASELFAQDAPIAGPLSVTATLPDNVQLSVDGQPAANGSIEGGRTMSLVIEPDPADEAVLRQGGPFLGAGAQTEATNEDYRFLMRAGYELGIHDWVIGSVAVETDFQTRFTSSLMVEIATPPRVVLILGLPSCSAGIGVTWDVSEEHGHRAGLRLAAGAGPPVVAVQGTFDYYASDDEWVIGLVGRVGL